jgi:hypothetical protein
MVTRRIRIGVAADGHVHGCRTQCSVLELIPGAMAGHDRSRLSIVGIDRPQGFVVLGIELIVFRRFESLDSVGFERTKEFASDEFQPFSVIVVDVRFPQDIVEIVESVEQVVGQLEVTCTFDAIAFPFEPVDLRGLTFAEFPDLFSELVACVSEFGSVGASNPVDRRGCGEEEYDNREDEYRAGQSGRLRRWKSQIRRPGEESRPERARL